MTPPLDLVDAVLQALRQSPCAQLFGDTWDGTAGVQKFFADYAQETSEPQAVIFEVGEQYTFMSPGRGNYRPFQADGSLQISVIAPQRYQARTLGQAVGDALNDAPLEWPLVNSVSIRWISAAFVPLTATIPGMPAGFNRTLTFQYQFFSNIQ